MLLPKFVWHDPTTGPNALVPTYPPINKQPFDAREAQRHDTITTSGRQQTILEREDQTKTFNFETVPESDLTYWDAFFQYALGGGTFFVHLDSTDSANIAYKLVDTKWDPKRTAYQLHKFSFVARRVVPAGSGS